MSEVDDLKARIEALEKTIESLTIYTTAVDHALAETLRALKARIDNPNSNTSFTPSFSIPTGLLPEHRAALHRLCR